MGRVQNGGTMIQGGMKWWYSDMGKDHTGGKVILNGINLVVWRDQTGGTVIGGWIKLVVQ